MANFCTECGCKVNERFKFCPKCGTIIVLSNQNKISGTGQTALKESEFKKKVEITVCDNCGDENPSDYEVCNSCGIKLDGSVIHKIVAEQKPVNERVEEPKQRKSVKPQKVNKKKKSKPIPKAEPQKEEKEFDTKKIYLIVTVISIFIIVILFSSGVLDSNVTSVNSGKGTNQSMGSGINLGNLQKINNLEARLESNPDDNETLLELAHLKNDSGFYDKAIPLYQRYLLKFPENADARIDMGVCMYNIGDYDNAIKEMKKALEYEPDHQIGHLNLGVVNLTAGNIEIAKEWFGKAINLGPDTDVGKKAKELLNSHKL